MHGSSCDLSRRARGAAALVAAVAITFVTTGCGNLRTLPGWRRAVVIYAPQRSEDAETARLLLASDGWQVDVVPQGPGQRSRSSVAVYDAKRYPKMPEHVRSVLEPLGATDGDSPKIDLLPFFNRGPAGTSAVLWLAE